MNQIGMNLSQGDQRKIFLRAHGPKLLQKDCPILFHRFAQVFLRQSQIQTRRAVSLAEPAHSSAETIA
jgi:hypothetical protein